MHRHDVLRGAARPGLPGGAAVVCRQYLSVVTDCAAAAHVAQEMDPVQVLLRAALLPSPCRPAVTGREDPALSTDDPPCLPVGEVHPLQVPVSTTHLCCPRRS